MSSHEHYRGGHKCLPGQTTGGDISVFPVKQQGGTQVSSWANYRVGHKCFPGQTTGGGDT